MWFIYFPVFVSVLSHLHYYPCFHLSSPTEEEREVLLSCFTSSVFPTTTSQKCVHMSINGLFFTLYSREEKILVRETLTLKNFEQLALSNYYFVTLRRCYYPFRLSVLLLGSISSTCLRAAFTLADPESTKSSLR